MPAKSKAQQRFFGLVRSVQKGDTPRNRVGKKVRDAADNISAKDVIDFASTKTKKLPETVTVTETRLRQLIREAVSETIKESFRGERGLSNLGQDSEPVAALNNAKLMAKNNEDPLKIKQTTGWEIGYDGNWKYEGTDGTFIQTPFNQINTLSDMWSDDDLFEWYPQLRNVRIEWKSDPNDPNFASATPGVISLPTSVVWWEQQYNDVNYRNFAERSAEQTVQHEIQHQIQAIELWNAGRPCPDYSRYKQIQDEALRELELAKQYRDITKEECYELYKNSPKNSMERRFFTELLFMLNDGYTCDDLIRDLQNEINKMPTFDELEKQYYDSPGEKEAYEVNNRYKWDQERRRNTLISRPDNN